MSQAEHPQKAIFLDRDGVLNVEQSFICSEEDLHVLPYAPLSVRKINEAGYLAFVVSNQSAVARNHCTTEDIDRIHAKLARELGREGAHLDKIYYCPHHPDVDPSTGNPEFIRKCSCRKPLPGMLQQAGEEFHVDLAHSWMIGDSARDIMAGKNAGCKTAGLIMGHALKNSRELPDYIFDNLEHAVCFILGSSFKSYENQLFEHIASLADKPVFIGVSGLPRSGKSIFIRKMMDFLAEKRRRSEWIDLNLYDYDFMNGKEREGLSHQEFLRLVKNTPSCSGSFKKYFPFDSEVHKLFEPGAADVVFIEQDQPVDKTEGVDIQIKIVMPEAQRKECVQTWAQWVREEDREGYEADTTTLHGGHSYDMVVENSFAF